MTKKAWISAAELMGELQKDPHHQQQQAARERLHSETAARVDVVSEPVIRSLREAGFAVDRVEELAPRYSPLTEPAIRVLLHWLPRVQDERVQEMIVRALGATTEPFDGVPLARSFETSNSESLRWAIANTLAVAHPTGLADWVLRTVSDPDSGQAREMLAIAAARLAPAEAANRTLAPLLQELPASVAHAFAISGGPAELALLEAQRDRTRGWQKKEIEKAIRAMRKGRTRAN